MHIPTKKLLTPNSRSWHNQEIRRGVQLFVVEYKNRA